MTWMAIASVFILRLIAQIAQLHVTKCTAVPFDPNQRRSIRHWPAILRRSRGVRFCVSDKAQTPHALGLFDSVVVIPTWMERCTASLDAILVHELEHLKRHDDWSSLLVALLQAVFFFNPAVRVICSQIELEREVACDEAAVAVAGNPLGYASRLTELARRLTSSVPLETLSLLGRRKILSLRVERLLRDSKTSTRPARAWIACVFAMIVMLLAIQGLAPVAAWTLGVPTDDTLVHRRAVALYRDFNNRRIPGQQMIAAEQAVSRLGNLLHLRLLQREERNGRDAFVYHLQAERGNGTLTMVTCQRDDEYAFTLVASGIDIAKKPVRAFAFTACPQDSQLEAP